MEKDRGTKVIAIVALIVAVVGLSLGFAAFSSTLTIEPSAIVIPEDNMHIIFSNINGAPTDTTIPGTMNQAMLDAKTALENAGVTAPNLPAAQNATINNTNKKAPIISNLVATFTAPGQSVEYNFYAYNEMQYQAFLRSITFDTSKYTCTPETGTDTTTANNVCQSIKVTVTVGSGTGAPVAYVVGNGATTKSEYTAATAHTLAATTGEAISVVIEYPTGSVETNGKVTVRMPDAQLVYSSAASD